ncbi:MAG: hypothetical protein ABFD60_04245 [Bryobacteraceae bacterium]
MSRQTDWERIRAEYETGTRSIRELAAIYGVSKDQIHRRKKAEGWVENLTARVKTHRNRGLAELDAKEYSEKEGGATHRDNKRDKERDRMRDTVAVSAAERQVEIVADHRKMLREMREVSREQIRLIRLWLHGNEEERKQAASVLFVRRSDSLVSHMNSAMGIVSRIIASEREAYGLNERENTDIDLNEVEALRGEIGRRLGSL